MTIINGIAIIIEKIIDFLICCFALNDKYTAGAAKKMTTEKKAFGLISKENNVANIG
ncbi:hypothetical protein KY317_04095 [Candidatus Woesearchaeota archaeon]|nr:hypothetical protein [Candidatus Woesearchaeota archaeon]